MLLMRQALQTSLQHKLKLSSAIWEVDELAETADFQDRKALGLGKITILGAKRAVER